MPRQPRNEYQNAYYHVMNRGAAKNPIFFNDKSYQIFLEILGEACKKFEVIVHSYCLMTNHYHILLQTPKGNLSQFMHDVGCKYVRKYNDFMQIDGPLFRGRYKAIIVDKDAYLLNLSRYIHRNPKIFVDDLQAYKWSSYPAYLGSITPQPWLNITETLQILSMDQTPSAYKEFVEKVPGTEVPGTLLYDYEKFLR